MRQTRWLVLLGVATASAYVWAAQADRIQAPLDNRVRVALRGNVPRVPAKAIDQGGVDPALPLTRMTLFFSRTPAQQAELDSLLEQQHDPSSPNYHQWLTPEQFAARFGVSEADLAKTAQWLQGQGFTLLEQSPSRNYIAFSGTAAQAQAAFGTEMHQYTLNGKTHFANVVDPTLPKALAEITLSVQGLHNFGPKPRGTVVRPRFTSSISGNHFLAPDDVATIYDLHPLYLQNIDGTKQSIAVMGQTAIDLNMVATFRSLSGLPPNAPQVVVIPGGSPTFISSSDLAEAHLDVEWPGAVARNATVIYVNSGSSGTVFSSLSYAITNNVAAVLSISYGNCEANWQASDITNFNGVFQQANAQGQTVVAPSGDDGAADCEAVNAKTATHGLAVDFPASSAFVSAIGGTLFSEGSNPALYWNPVNTPSNASALSYIPEVVWDETAANQGILAAAGGGKSSRFAKPSWQTALTPADGQRDVPDISLAAGFAHDGYLICASGQTPGDCSNGFRDSNNNLDVIGGTSAGVPVFAGIVALLNQKMGASQGNVNPKLYALAANSADAFHDITTGGNAVTCAAGFKFPDGSTCPPNGQIGYTSCVGYDYASGLGSVDASNLIAELAGGAIPAASPDFSICPAGMPTMTVAHGSSGTITVSVAALYGFSGTVTFTCVVPNTLVGVTCTPPTPMSAPYGAATFTLTASPTAKLTPPGTSPAFMAWNWGGGMLVAGLLLGAGERKNKNRSLRAFLLGGALLVVLLVALAGCGGGSASNSAAPSPAFTPESGTITLQATSNNTVHSVPITLNIN